MGADTTDVDRGFLDMLGDVDPAATLESTSSKVIARVTVIGCDAPAQRPRTVTSGPLVLPMTAGKAKGIAHDLVGNQAALRTARAELARARKLVAALAERDELLREQMGQAMLTLGVRAIDVPGGRVSRGSDITEPSPTGELEIVSTVVRVDLDKSPPTTSRQLPLVG